MCRHNLYMFRCDRKLTMGQMAKRLGCSRTTYSNIERGLRDGEQKVWEALQREFNIPDSEMWKLQKLEERKESDKCELTNEK